MSVTGEQVAITIDGCEHTVSTGITIHEALVLAGHPTRAPCGGKGACGKCAVLVNGSSVRSCAGLIRDGLDISIPSANRIGGDRILTDFGELGVPGPTTHGDADARGLGVAVDVGTTTIVVYLVDLASMTILGTASVINPQFVAGDDVLARIRYCGDHPDGLVRLSTLVRKAMEGCIETLLKDAPYDPDGTRPSVTRMVCVGNPTMMHILMQKDPASIGRAPFEPMVRDTMVGAYGTIMGLGTDSYGVPTSLRKTGVLIPGPISGYVGADTLAVMRAVRDRTGSGTHIIVDLGTNAETVLLRAGGEDLACSSAAGPAFEGRNISCGMRATDGAITGCTLSDGAISCEMIGEGPATGLSGSGVVSVIAELVYAGLIDGNGRFVERDGAMGGRVLPPDADLEDPRGPRFIISKGEAKGTQAVYIDQRDIRELQLAKGAVAAGIARLLQEASIGTRDLGSIFVAGAFGNGMDPADAMTIGLVPGSGEVSIVPVGNGAGLGAILMLGDDVWEPAGDGMEGGSEVRYLELSADRGFNALFMEHLGFGPGSG